MKTRTKALVLALCAVLLVVTTVFATVAYLTSTDSVTNTFSVGNVKITLDEEDVDDSKTDSITEGRDKKNAYKLIPGKEYKKDPIVHVDETSENCYVFVKVANGISAYEAAEAAGENAYAPIEKQIENNGWTLLENAGNGSVKVYYQEYTKDQTDKDLEVFANFKIADNADTVDGWETMNATITVTAYAIQKDGMNNVNEAWRIVSESENG